MSGKLGDGLCEPFWLKSDEDDAMPTRSLNAGTTGQRGIVDREQKAGDESLPLSAYRRDQVDL